VSLLLRSAFENCKQRAIDFDQPQSRAGILLFLAFMLLRMALRLRFFG
jgi:hypothetical protein